jgi:hypothetical protein
MRGPASSPNATSPNGGSPNRGSPNRGSPNSGSPKQYRHGDLPKQYRHGDLPKRHFAKSPVPQTVLGYVRLGTIKRHSWNRAFG